MNGVATASAFRVACMSDSLKRLALGVGCLAALALAVAANADDKEPSVAEHWAYRPIVRPKVPDIAGTCRTDIDRFILAALEAKKLALSPEADRETLIRRVSFDLTGLPPT